MPEGFGQSIKPTAARRPQQPPRKHDGLCITETRDYGMQYCWCNKPCCWHAEGMVRDKRKFRNSEEREEAERTRARKGRCICRECPCHDPVYLLPSMSLSTMFSQPRENGAHEHH